MWSFLNAASFRSLRFEVYSSSICEPYIGSIISLGPHLGKCQSPGLMQQEQDFPETLATSPIGRST